MKRIIANRHYLKKNMVAIIALSLSLYFAYHLVAGPRGYFKLKELEYQISQSSERLDAAQSERSNIEKKVVLMRPGTMCRDLLEERVRYVLGYSTKEEYLLLHNRS